MQGEYETANASHIEFVTDPFPETTDGERRLSDAMDSITAVVATLRERARPNQTVWVPATDLVSQGVTAARPEVQVQADANPSSNPQVTGAIRLDRLQHFFESFATQTSRVRTMFGANLGAGSAMIDTAAATYKRSTGKNASPQLKGLLNVIRNYVIDSRRVHAYPKAMAKILMRTDFATAFKLLPEARTISRKLWVKIVAEASNEQNLDRPMLVIAPRGLNETVDQYKARAKDHLTLRKWLHDIHGGTDTMTSANYPRQDTRADMESMGSLGSRTETVTATSKKGKQITYAAPIMEIRTLMRPLPLNFLKPFALDVFGNIRRLNQSRTAPAMRTTHLDVVNPPAVAAVAVA